MLSRTTLSNVRRWLRTAALGLTLTALAPAAGHALDIKLVNSPDGKTVTLELTGAFRPGDGLRLRALVARIPAETRIVAHLNADGGSFVEGMSVGRFFHQIGVRTVIPAKARCILPCPLAFLGGKSRVDGEIGQVKHSTAGFGFSSFSPTAPERNYTADDLDKAVASTQAGILLVADYLVEVGADIDFLKHIYDEVPDRTVRFMSNEELLGLGINIVDDESNQLIEAQALRRRLAR
jgi:hypothetical protein